MVLDHRCQTVSGTGPARLEESTKVLVFGMPESVIAVLSNASIVQAPSGHPYIYTSAHLRICFELSICWPATSTKTFCVSSAITTLPSRGTSQPLSVTFSSVVVAGIWTCPTIAHWLFVLVLQEINHLFALLFCPLPDKPRFFLTSPLLLEVRSSTVLD